MKKKWIKNYTKLLIATTLVVLLALMLLCNWWLDLDLVDTVDSIWIFIWETLIHFSGLYALCEYVDYEHVAKNHLLAACVFIIFCYILYRIDDNRLRKKNRNR